MSGDSTIVLFRQDLRIEDHPSLTAAIMQGPVIPVYIFAPQEEGEWVEGAASKWWLHFSLVDFQKQLKEIGLSLLVYQGDTLQILKNLIKETGAKRVFWSRRYEPYSIARDSEIKKILQFDLVEVRSFNASLLFEPWTIANKQGKPFRVFTPFWKTCQSSFEIEPPLPKPTKATAVKSLKSDSLESLDLLQKKTWEEGLHLEWHPGADGAKRALNAFLNQGILNYSEARDRPDQRGVSQISPYLHFGQLSPKMVWAKVIKNKSINESGPECFLRQLGWREFAYHLLYHFPFTPTKPLRTEFQQFPWKQDRVSLEAWKKGMTGYPFVDAGMRQLLKTGWMHNRVRMVAASFLVKDLQINWTEGAKWFWDTLVDADLANNTLGWQWVAGCGADAAPYFRIFNPTSQGEKFDPDGAYVRKWVPELSLMPSKWIHRPWEAPLEVLNQAGVSIGRTYPHPIVVHAKARLEALAAFSSLRKLQDM